MPALSASGQSLAFVWRGDIWVASSQGGPARQVTSSVELDSYPVFSPKDEGRLAFGTLRNGNWDIYVVSVAGGAPKQVTRSGGSEIPTGWSPDGKKVLFSSQRDTPRPSLFSIEVETGRFTKLTEDYAGLSRPQLSADGQTLYFERSGFPWTRPRYHGSAAAQLWSLDLPTGKRKVIRSNGLQHLWPQWTERGIVCVTVGEPTPNNPVLGKPITFTDSAQKTPNLWLFPQTNGTVGKPTRLTNFVGEAVRWPSARAGAVAFEYGPDLYLWRPEEKAPQKLVFTVSTDDKLSPRQRQTIESADVEEAEISPDGKTFAFKLRSDLWTILVEKPKNDRNADDARRLTDYPGLDEDFVWAEGGKSLFFVSDRDGIARVYRMEVATNEVKPVWNGKEDARGPVSTDGGKSILFWVSGVAGSEAGLYEVPADLSHAPRRLLALPGAAHGMATLSPDGTYLAYTRRNAESGAYNLWIQPRDGAKAAVNVTRLNAWHGNPRFSPDGRYLFFSSNRDGDGLYALPLTPETARTDELEMLFQKPSGTDPVKTLIDFTDCEGRIRKLLSQPIDADLDVAEDGTLLFVSGGDAWSCPFDGKTPTRRTFLGDVTNLRLVEGGKKIALRSRGQIYTMPLTPGAVPAAVKFRAVWERDVRAERKAAFDEFWRIYNRRFHDPHFHGRDWAEMKKRYEPRLEGVDTRDEFAQLLNLMVGELEASHAEVSAAPGGPPSPSTAVLGFTFDYSHTGPGIKIKDVPKRAPGSYEKTRLRPGEFVLSIDGAEVSLTEDLFSVLNNKGERDFELLVNDRPAKDGARIVRYKALSGGEWSQIFYRNRIEARRRSVESLGGGKLGYVHIAGMGGGNQTTFEREFYEEAEGKSAMIIDVRENGGGNIGDTLLSWLAIKPYGTYLPRDGFPVPSPTPAFALRAWNRPIVVLMNESSFSNAEMFPYGMRATGLATLIGMPTPGYVIWTWEGQLVDGTRIRIPGQSVFRRDGTSLENKGEEPDFKIPWSNEDYLAGRDPQLEKAIALLLKK
jgi:Tol biopolymer transport system component/C-terminal processing protease CtpA/Prc